MTNRHAIAALLLIFPPGLSRADTVTLSPTSPGAQPYVIEGTIVDYRGDEITLQQGRGVTKRYASERVVEINTDWPEAFDDSKRLIQARDWTSAAPKLVEASRAEQRGWAKRVILVELLRCRCALGQMHASGELLVALNQEDPATPAWRLAPLPWHASDAVSEAQARAWLASRQETARLLGATWLLNTQHRPAARAELQELSQSPREVVATLAECQLWRLDLLRADARQADRWASRIAELPPNLTSGPEHLLAQAYYRQRRYDEAALAALRAPLEGRSPHRLAARGLLLAARALSASEQPNEARTLLDEIARDYPDTPVSNDVQAMLENTP